MEAALANLKQQGAKIRSSQFVFQAALLDPEVIFRSIGFTNFLSTWLIRQVDPKGKHPNPIVDLPLPQEVPMAFRVLPEYIVEDIVEYLFFAVQYAISRIFSRKLSQLKPGPHQTSLNFLARSS